MQAGPPRSEGGLESQLRTLWKTRTRSCVDPTQPSVRGGARVFQHRSEAIQSAVVAALCRRTPKVPRVESFRLLGYATVRPQKAAVFGRHSANPTAAMLPQK